LKIEHSAFERLGRYTLSAYSRADTNGLFLATLSVRSGHGQGSHDRVFQFTPRFETADAARQYAREQGHLMVRQPMRLA